MEGVVAVLVVVVRWWECGGSGGGCNIGVMGSGVNEGVSCRVSGGCVLLHLDVISI